MTGWMRRHRRAVIIALVVMGVLALVFGTKAVLLLNFLTGNDTVVRLEAKQKTFAVAKGETVEAVFTASVTANPFCTVRCAYRFEDLSSGALISEEAFTMKPGTPATQVFHIGKKLQGTGQGWYRLSMDCASKRTLLCQTDEEPTQRSVLLTVEEQLNRTEAALKEALRPRLLAHAIAMDDVQAMLEAAYAMLRAANTTIAVDSMLGNVSGLNESITQQRAGSEAMRALWMEERYSELERAVDAAERRVREIEAKAAALNASAAAVQRQYNVMVRQLEATEGVLRGWHDKLVLNETSAAAMNATIALFKSTLSKFEERAGVESKEMVVASIVAMTKDVQNQFADAEKREIVSRALAYDVWNRAWCGVEGACALTTLAFNASELAPVCAAVEQLRVLNAVRNEEVGTAVTAEGYVMNETFTGNVSAKAGNMLRNASITYRAAMANETNRELLERLLMDEPFTETERYSYNLSPILQQELLELQPEACVPLKLATLPEAQLNEVEWRSVSVNTPFTLEEPAPQCCAFGECRTCCTTAQCRGKINATPVVFLHGHAFNRDSPADYSLDAFNKMQERLENEGYVDAGAVSLYTERDVPYGAWSAAGVPISVKASYYFDLFETPENYVVVQTKSESIDTYAVRLKELLDTVSYLTGRRDVVLVAHSMGGLVARRYVQVFGSEKVAKLIMIGTPNQGIEGSIASFCGLLGENLECRDMQAGSLFLNKLNRGEQPDMRVVNMIGAGCSMDGGRGDGIVLEKNARLDGKENVVINGTCTKLRSLHSAMLDVDAYPEVYATVVAVLRN